MLHVFTTRVVACLVALLGAGTATAQLQLLPLEAVRDGRVEAELIAEHTTLMPGETARVGLRLEMDEGWHTYWKNPGDSGLATTIEWDLPEGFVAHGIDWPAPDYFEVNGLASYGYEGEIVLPVRIKVPEEVSGEQVTLRAIADWLVCKEACEPGTAELSLTLPISTTGSLEADPDTEQLFAWAQPRVAMYLGDEHHGVETGVMGSFYQLKLAPSHAPHFANEWVDVRFFAEDPAAIEMGATQKASFSPVSGLTVDLVRNQTAAEPVERLVGVLAWHHPKDLNATRFYRINVPVRNVAGGE